MYGFDIPLKALPLEKKSQTEQTSQKNTAEQKTTQHRSNMVSVLHGFKHMITHAKTTQTTDSQTDRCFFRANVRKIYARIKK